MNIEIINDEAGFKALESEWNQLLERSVTNVPFLRHDFQYVWWSTLGGGEWPAGDLWLLVGRGGDGELAAIAPLWAGTTLDDQQGLMFIGTKEISDYLDLIAAPEALPAFIPDMLDALEASGPEGWEVLDLFNILESSPTLEALSQAAADRGWRVEREKLEPCPVVTLEGGWEGYMARLEGKYRHELRRKIRRANSYPLSVSWRQIGADEDIEPHIDAFIELMEHDPEKVEFLTPEMREHFRRSIRAAHEGGWLMMAFLDVGQRHGAAYLNYDYANRVWVYNSGLDPEFYSLSPGWVLMAHIIEWGIDAGREAVDFLRGHEKYKYRLGGVPRRIYRLRIFPAP